MKAGSSTEVEQAEPDCGQDADGAQEEDEEAEKPSHWTFKDNLLLKLQQIDQQVRDEDHVAARKLDLDIKECILDKSLKE